MTDISRDEDEKLVDFSIRLAEYYKSKSSISDRKTNGQYFTPKEISQFMASLYSLNQKKIAILDPGAGTGILIAAVCDLLKESKKETKLIHADLYEIDSNLIPLLENVLNECKTVLESDGHSFSFTIFNEDFILKNSSSFNRKEIPLDNGVQIRLFDLIISNPPYFKLRKDSPQAQAMKDIIHGQPNIYVLFIALSTSLLKKEGQMIFITPRSFCSGSYFNKFRKWFINNVSLKFIHVFDSRSDVFYGDEILQENIILYAINKDIKLESDITISSSKDSSFVGRIEILRDFNDIIHKKNGSIIIRLPILKIDYKIMKIMDSFPFTFQDLDIEISTGPVVPFRATEYLRDEHREGKTVPLIWMHNIQNFHVRWPLNRNGKENAVLIGERSKSILIPVSNYVCIKRFSSKDQARRLFAGVLRQKEFSHFSFIGVENHINYIHKPQSALTEDEAFGIAAFLNSMIVDNYFRTLNGHTQVNATDIRNVPFPSLQVLSKMGKEVKKHPLIGHALDLEISDFLNIEKDIIYELYPETSTMGKIETVIKILKDVGLPRAQQNERSAIALLAMTNLKEQTPWADAEQNLLRIHDMLIFSEKVYNKPYAENSRETFRRQTIHQFEQAGIAVRNPDEPTRSTNSPKNVYTISNEFLQVIRSFDTDNWNDALYQFISEKGKLADIYSKKKEDRKLIFKVEDKLIKLSPGKHNKLQIAVVEDLQPRFFPNAKLVYVGDTDNKMLVLNEELVKDLKIPITRHDKLPDLIYYDSKTNRIFLIEVVTSHGPVSPKRQQELEKTFANCLAERIYITAFPSKKEFKKHFDNIAWETEVWIENNPGHMIHFNGPKFLFVYDQFAENDKSKGVQKDTKQSRMDSFIDET